MPTQLPVTVSTINSLQQWADHPLGKVARGSIAMLGLVSSILILRLANMYDNAAWTLVLLGVALAATSLRAAIRPTMVRLTTLAAVMIAIPYVGQTL